MQSEYYQTPTIVLFTDRTDLGTRLSKTFVSAKKYLGEDGVENAHSQSATINTNTGNPQSLTTIAKEIINHLEKIKSKSTTPQSKAIIVSSKQEITPKLYKTILTHLGRRSSGFDEINTTNYAQYFTNHFGHPKEWHITNLPHRNKKELIQFITFRQADSLPQTVLRKIEKELKHLRDEKKDIEKRKKYQSWLDKGLGSCALAQLEMGTDCTASFSASQWS